ncbi:MAG: octaprenyl-diphosphate synthase [Candidatus Deianiraeaceae bacterium]|jgi:octaprenyl-diphosphate synthase
MSLNIAHVYFFVQKEINLLNAKLKTLSTGEYKLVSDITLHVAQKGKRVRPALLFLIAKSFGIKDVNAIVNSAFAIEMIHTASLLHDDVVDGSGKRRGKKTANILWGNKETILVGDYLFTQSFLAVVELQNSEAVQIIAESSSKLTIGEITQLENERNISLTFDEYLVVIYHKTASLFEASAKLGSVFSNSNKIRECGNFGKNIGMAFQMMDDILDYAGSQALGKDIGVDFREKKVTLPILILLQNTDKSETKIIKQYFQKSGEMQIAQIHDLMNRYDVLTKCHNFMNTYIEDANKFIMHEIPCSKTQEMLLTLLNFFTKRNF